MGKGAENIDTNASFSWNEIKDHNKKTDLWIVINNYVYDITNFQKVHPGGVRIINHYAGQDASEAFTAFHKDEEKTKKYMKLYCIGKLAPEYENAISDENKSEAFEKKELMIKDFENLREVANKMGLFEPNIIFFLLHGLHILFFQILGFFILCKYGNSLLAWLAALICHSIAQAQAGWSQHDYGHLSVFKTSKMNRYMHLVYIGLIKGASGHWWNYLHNQHHAKPNVLRKDPDVGLEPVFVVGELSARRIAEKNFKNKKTKVFPYEQQHKYFFITAAMLIPFFFQFTTIRHAINKKVNLDLAFIAVMYLIYFTLTVPSIGVLGSVVYFFCFRILESTWFTWVTQSNHIVMDVHDDDSTDSWLSMQLRATCNIDQSWFNDWFTGHLNFQIEHHLFPTMPRHNYYKIQPLVKSLCKKHGMVYTSKSLTRAFLDIIFSLKKSAQVYTEAYKELKD